MLDAGTMSAVALPRPLILLVIGCLLFSGCQSARVLASSGARGSALGVVVIAAFVAGLALLARPFVERWSARRPGARR